MKIGLPKEIKTHEYRVGMTPAGVRELCLHEHHALVETGAGAQIGFSDSDYTEAGAQVLSNASAVYEQADLIVKVKEPQAHECQMLREGQLLFTFLHLAADPNQARLLCQSGCTAIAYETVTDRAGRLPLLCPMSEIAGRLAVQAGARCLETICGGRGVLLGGAPGVPPANVVVLGGGVVGTQAIRMALGLEARVTVIDNNIQRLRELSEHHGSRLTTQFSTKGSVEEAVKDADLLVGAVLLAGGSAPKLVSEAMVASMKPGSVVVDVAIDQGGCLATSKPTTHDAPTYIKHNVVHYCVSNMPGAVARTSTLALTNATLPYIKRLADSGVDAVFDPDSQLLSGLNIHRGHVTHPAVAEALGVEYVKPAP